MGNQSDVSGETLSAIDISMVFSGVKALQNVSFTVKRGEVFGLIGPNGSGKTTSLNCITGTYRPTSGRVELNGTDITRKSVRQRVRMGIARTFQAVRTFDRLTVYENIMAASLASGESRKNAGIVADRQIDDFGLEEYRDYACSSVPAGMLRNVGVARAVACNPRFILLDEPAAGQNEVEVHALITQIKQLAKKNNLGVLLIEHDMSVVMGSCDTLHVLDHGQTELSGDPEEVYGDPRVKEIYFGKREA